MTEKRYSDGTLAKWYYSQENVISDGTNEYYLASKESIRNVDYSMLLGTNDLLDELNRLSDENEQLKQQLEDSKNYNATLYQNGMKNEREWIKTFKELEEENERIKQTIQEAIQNERTQIGQSVLQQLYEAIQ